MDSACACRLFWRLWRWACCSTVQPLTWEGRRKRCRGCRCLVTFSRKPTCYYYNSLLQFIIFHPSPSFPSCVISNLQHHPLSSSALHLEPLTLLPPLLPSALQFHNAFIPSRPFPLLQIISFQPSPSFPSCVISNMQHHPPSSRALYFWVRTSHSPPPSSSLGSSES